MEATGPEYVRPTLLGLMSNTHSRSTISDHIYNLRKNIKYV